MTRDEQAVEERARQALAWLRAVMRAPGTTRAHMKVAELLAWDGSTVASLAELAATAGVSRAGVRRAIAWLERGGLITVRRTKGKDGASLPNEYTPVAAKRVAE